MKLTLSSFKGLSHNPSLLCINWSLLTLQKQQTFALPFVVHRCSCMFCWSQLVHQRAASIHEPSSVAWLRFPVFSYLMFLSQRPCCFWGEFAAELVFSSLLTDFISMVFMVTRTYLWCRHMLDTPVTDIFRNKYTWIYITLKIIWGQNVCSSKFTWARSQMNSSVCSCMKVYPSVCASVCVSLCDLVVF